MPNESFVDIHCHITPGIDDGAKDWEQSLEMARMAVADGIGAIVATPHQLGNFSHNSGELIRQRVAELQQKLEENQIPLRVLPGADVRIEPKMVKAVERGEVVSLGDHRKHVLLELPHELYVPLDRLLEELKTAGMVGILSHPERNLGILAERSVLKGLVRSGCLMQVTAGSLLGTFGAQSQKFSEWMLDQGIVHFISTDAHGPRARRPLLREAFDRAVKLVGQNMAMEMFCHNPAAVFAGQPVVPRAVVAKSRGVRSWLGLRGAA